MPRSRSSSRIRVATLQYFIRPVRTFQEFADQAEALVDTAHDYDCRLLVFPEYFPIQLLTLGDVKKPMTEQIRRLALQVPAITELMSNLAAEHGLYIVAGSVPTLAPDGVTTYNESYFFSPTGAHAVQPKLHMTRWEREEWEISPGRGVRVFDTELGKIAIAICYDVEFPEIARAAAHAGCYMLVVPSCTDERQGFLRVRYCAQARAIENQMYVIHACTVGSLPMVPAVSLNYGQASILTPSDFPFARDGILAEGNVNQEQMVIGELNIDTIKEARETGTVLPLRDNLTTKEVTSTLEEIRL